MPVLNPIFEKKREDLFKSTEIRFFSLLKPVQETSYKYSDYFAYALTPLIDLFLLEPLYTVNASIHFINATSALATALYLWTNNQQKYSSLIDLETRKALGEAGDHALHGISNLVAQTLNTIISLIALFTRCFASIMYATTQVDLYTQSLEEAKKVAIKC